MPQAQVIGLGRSGIAAAKLLKQQGWQVVLSDRSNSEKLQVQKQELEKDGIIASLGHNLTLDPQNLPNLIVVSPGVPWDIPALIEARSLGVETVGEIELAWRYLDNYPWVGITGTNGKTTTTALIAAIFQTAGLNAPACGNIGNAACELALKENLNLDQEVNNNHNYDWIIAELSSYQIEASSQLTPQIGIWTTFTPDHLARHKTLENYYTIKASLLRRCPQQVINGDDPYLHSLGLEHWSNACWTSVKGKDSLVCQVSQGVYIENGWVIAFEEPILPVDSLKMVGVHNQQNLLMAVATARLAGIDKEAIAHAICNFPGVSHRLELVYTFAGTDFINDSKATNYDAAQVGLGAVEAPVILIAGGEAKQGDDTAWINTIKAKASHVLLIGKAATQFSQRLHDSGYRNYEIVETMVTAVSRSVQLAQQEDISVVLLSPACASFDQYQSFEHRGEHFRQLCQQIQI